MVSYSREDFLTILGPNRNDGSGHAVCTGSMPPALAVTTPGQNPIPKSTVDLDALDHRMASFALRARSRCETSLVVRSRTGRPTWAVTIAAEGRVPDRERPQAVVVAGLHGAEQDASELALHLLDLATALPTALPSAPEAAMRQAVDAALHVADLTIVVCLDPDPVSVLPADNPEAGRWMTNRPATGPCTDPFALSRPDLCESRPISSGAAAGMGALATTIGPATVLDLRDDEVVVVHHPRNESNGVPRLDPFTAIADACRATRKPTNINLARPPRSAGPDQGTDAGGGVGRGGVTTCDA